MAIVEELSGLPSNEEAEKLTSRTDQDDQTLRRFRHELRGVNDCLRKDRVYKDFARPVNLEQYPDYLTIIQTPINLQDIYVKINNGEYYAPQDYIDDFELIYSNAVLYCGERSDVVQKALKHLFD